LLEEKTNEVKILSDEVKKKTNEITLLDNKVKKKTDEVITLNNTVRKKTDKVKSMKQELKKMKGVMQGLKEKYVKEQNKIESKIAILEKRLHLGTFDGKVDQNDKVKATNKSHQSTTTTPSSIQPDDIQKLLSGKFGEIKQGSKMKRKEKRISPQELTERSNETKNENLWGKLGATLSSAMSLIPTYGFYPQHEIEDNDNEDSDESDDSGNNDNDSKD